MKTEKMTQPEMLLIAIGLLLSTSSTLVNDWVHLPDFFRGFLVGVGLAFEVFALILIAKRKRALNNSRNSRMHF